MAGVRVPVVPMSHEYLITQPFRERDPAKPLPTLRDPDLLIYFREEGGGLVMGGYERPSSPAFLPDEAGFERIPADFNGRLLEDDWDRFEEIVRNSRRRVPQMEDVKVTRMINGPEGFTPDNEFCLGETEVRGLFVAAGFCAHGLAGAGGVGRVMAEWIAEGEPSLDLWEMDVRRFGAHYRSPSYTLKRIRETYETYYDIRYPHHEREAGRPLRTAAANPWHREHGAAFGEKSGWERVNWYEQNASAGDELSAPPRLGGPALVARDRRRAPRDPRGRRDLRRELVREDGDRRAGRSRVPREPLRQPRRPRGREDHLHPDAQPTRRDRVRLHGGTPRRGALLDRDRHGLRQPRPGVDPQAPARRRQRARPRRDLGLSCFGIWGPRAREVLQPLTPQDLASEAFPYMSLRETTVADVPVRALRVTYVGELGWELYCPAEYGLGLWRTLWEAGQPHGLVAGGYRAIDSMRLEKGYRVWGADITPDETPYEGGVGFCVKLDKEFLGREALVEREPRVKLCCLLLEDPLSVALGNEPVRVGGEIVGRVTTGGYGYTVERSIAYAYLPPEHADPGTAIAVEIFDRWIDGEVAREPLFDPKGERIRA